MRSRNKMHDLILMAGTICQRVIPTNLIVNQRVARSLRYPTTCLLVATMLAALCPAELHAEASIGLYNPVNHGLIVSFSPTAEPLNEFSADRIGKAHEIFRPAQTADDFPFAPFYVDKEIIDFYQANPNAPFILGEIYEPWELANPQLPGRSFYQNVKISPSEPEAKLGVVDTWGYFNPMAFRSSSTAGSGLGGNGGRLTLTSPNLDTGFGEAVGEITPEGDIKLQVDINRSGGPGFTPVAEAALEATMSDTFTINLAQSDPVLARLSVSAQASIPVLDFSRSNFYSYAVGYQFAIYEPITFGETAAGQFLLNNPDPTGEFSITPEQAALPAFREYWGASGLYWVDARQRDPGPFLGDEKFVTIESIGLPVPDMPGVAESQLPVEFLDLGGDIGETDIPVAFKDIREFSYTAFDPGDKFLYDDPLMPFNEFKAVENVLLPTNKPLKVALNFFVMAGGSDSSAFPINFFIDGGNTAGFGISIDNPNAQIVSDAGFNYRPIAIGIPEASTLATSSLVIAIMGVVVAERCRRACQKVSSTPVAR